MPKSALKTFKLILLNAKDDVQVVNGCSRCPHSNDNESLRTDDNLTNRLAKFKNTIKEKEN